MAIKSLFFNSASETNLDRVYDTSDWSDYFKGIVSDGVLMQNETSLKVAVSSGMNIVVKQGSAYISGRKLVLDTDTIFAIQGSHATYARVDAVVMAKDMVNRKMNIYVKTGTPSATPVYPSVIVSENLEEHLLATVTIPAGASSLLSSNIRDMRGTDCGCIYGNDKLKKFYQARYETLGDSVGWYDNINVNQIVKAFFEGGRYQTYDFTNSDANAQLKLDIVGEFNINENSQYDSISPAYFGFTTASGTPKRVILDFSNCIINFNFSDLEIKPMFKLISNGGLNTVELRNIKMNGVINSTTNAQMTFIDNFKSVSNVRLRVVNYTNVGIYGINIQDGENGLIDNCFVEILNQGIMSNAQNIYAFISTAVESDIALPHKFVNCIARVTSSSNTYYTLHGFAGIGIFDKCNAYIYNMGTNTLAYSTGFDNNASNDGLASYTNCTCYVTGSAVVEGFSGNGRYTNCRSHAASNGTEGNYCASFSILGEATNCYALSRNAGNGSAYGIMLPIGEMSGKLRLFGCTAMGFCSVYEQDTASVYAHGISVSQTTTGQALICVGCRVPSHGITNFVQKGSIRISGTTSGCAGLLSGNIVYTAITKHSGTNLTEQATIVQN